MFETITRGQNVRWILASHGFTGTIRWLRRSLPYHLWLHLTPRGRRELSFDRQNGVLTEGNVQHWLLGGKGANAEFAVQYAPTKPKRFFDLVDPLQINHKDFTFIDIGSGKGRVLILANRYAFQRIVGVEFSELLCAIARSNLVATGTSADIVCMDAAEYRFPAEPLVIYMCNPFGERPMRMMLHNLEASLQEYPRPAYLLYWNNVHDPLIAKCSAFRRIRFSKGQLSVYEHTA